MYNFPRQGAMSPAEVRLSLEEAKRRRIAAMSQTMSQGMEGVRGGIMDIETARKAREAEMRARMLEDEERKRKAAEEARRKAAEEREAFDHQAKRATGIAAGADLHAASVSDAGPQPYQRGVQDSIRSAGIDKLSDAEIGSLAGRRAETVEESRRAREMEDERRRIMGEREARDGRKEKLAPGALGAVRENESVLDGYDEEDIEKLAQELTSSVGSGVTPEQARAAVVNAIEEERSRFAEEGRRERASETRAAAAAAKQSARAKPTALDNKLREKSIAAREKAQFFDDVLRVEKDLGVWTHPVRTGWEGLREFFTGAADKDWAVLDNLLSPEYAMQIREMGGAHLSDNEKVLYSKAMPTINDSPDRRTQKLYTLKAMMERDAHYYETGELLPLDIRAIAPWYEGGGVSAGSRQAPRSGGAPASQPPPQDRAPAGNEPPPGAAEYAAQLSNDPRLSDQEREEMFRSWLEAQR